MKRLIRDTLVIAERNLVRLPRAPDLLLAFTVQPIMFVLLFRYVFGGAIRTPGYSYVDFLIPGIIVQNIAFGGFVTAVGLNEDVHKGLIDRFRSLPMARPAVLAGRTLSDVVTNGLSVTVLVITGLIIGFSFHTGVLSVIAGLGVLLLFGYAFSWLFALLGLLVSSPEAANSVGFIAVFPLTFISSAFVPVGTLPAVLKTFAQVNPFTITVDAMRSLWLGAPAHNNVWGAVVWSLVIWRCSRPWPSPAIGARRGADLGLCDRLGSRCGDGWRERHQGAGLSRPAARRGDGALPRVGAHPRARLDLHGRTSPSHPGGGGALPDPSHRQGQRARPRRIDPRPESLLQHGPLLLWGLPATTGQVHVQVAVLR